MEEERFTAHKKNIDILANEGGALSNDEEDDLNEVFQRNFIGSEANSLVSVLRVLHLKVKQIDRAISKAKKMTSCKKQERAAFGRVMHHDLDDKLNAEIEEIRRDGLQAKLLTLEQAMLLTQILAQFKTENMRLKLKCREQEIKINHMEQYMPGLSKKADEMSRPEATPE